MKITEFYPMPGVKTTMAVEGKDIIGFVEAKITFKTNSGSDTKLTGSKTKIAFIVIDKEANG